MQLWGKIRFVIEEGGGRGREEDGGGGGGGGESVGEEGREGGGGGGGGGGGEEAIINLHQSMIFLYFLLYKNLCTFFSFMCFLDILTTCFEVLRHTLIIIG